MTLFLFLIYLRHMVDNPETDELVSWNASNNGFVVWDTLRFSSEVLPKYYKTKKLASFVRQLNKYGFRKNTASRQWEYISKNFTKGDNYLEQKTKREETVVESPPAGESTGKRQVLKMKGKRKTIDDEDRQSIDIQSTSQLLLAQQMIPFFAKAIQTPEFALLLASQMNDCSSQISSDIKRRRQLPNSSYRRLMDEHEPENVISEQFMITTTLTTPGSTKLKNTNDFLGTNIDPAVSRGSSSNRATHDESDVLSNTFALIHIHPSYSCAHDYTRMPDNWPFKGSCSAACNNEIPIPHQPSKNYNVSGVSPLESKALHNMVPLADILQPSYGTAPEARAGTVIQEENVDGGAAENTYLASDVPNLSTSNCLRESPDSSFKKMTASTTRPGSTTLGTRVVYRGSSSSGAIHSESNVLSNTFTLANIHPSPHANAPEAITIAHANAPEATISAGVQEESIDGGAENTDYASYFSNLSTSDYAWDYVDMSFLDDN